VPGKFSPPACEDEFGVLAIQKLVTGVAIPGIAAQQLMLAEAPEFASPAVGRPLVRLTDIVIGIGTIAVRLCGPVEQNIDFLVANWWVVRTPESLTPVKTG
jgi:hypothetical protein